MPNICWNKVTITANTSTITTLTDANLSFETLYPRPVDVDWYEWNTKHYGTKWDRGNYKVLQHGKEGLLATFETAWVPPLPFFEKLIEFYSDVWVKLEWTTEDGLAGVWVAYTKQGTPVIKTLEWEEMCLEEGSHRFRPL
jgi:hypothetical protein